MKKIVIVFVGCLVYSLGLFGQCTVRGKVTDENGETMVGVTISLKSDRKVAASTDLDGNFSLKIPVATPQVILVSFISYQTLEEPINAKKGEVVVLDMQMEPQTKAINEVVVSSRSNKSDGKYMQSIKARSIQSIDFVSSASMKKTGDASVVAAVARVTGVSTSGGFITVRGIGDRYVKTAINGSRIPTLDPITNNIKLDLFPASLVDNIVITKTASADLPGDWAGAYLSIETKDYPDKLTITAESSLGYTEQTTLKNTPSSVRSKTDWLGYDNGLREYDNAKYRADNVQAYRFTNNLSKYETYSALGLQEYFNSIGVNGNTPWNETYTKQALVQLGLLDKSLMGDRAAYTAALEKYTELGYDDKALKTVNEKAVEANKGFANNWTVTERKTPLNFSQSFSIGNQSTVFGRQLGYLFGFRYSSSTTSDINAITNTVRDTSMAINSTGKRMIGNETNGWSALFNLAYKFNNNNSISFMFMPNVIGANRIRLTNTVSSSSGAIIDDPNPEKSEKFGQKYESRRQMVYQAKTEHFIPSIQLKIESNISLTKGNSNSPDMKDYKTNGSAIEIGAITRSFAYLVEDVLDSRISLELPIVKKQGLVRRIKMGGAFQQSYRKWQEYIYNWVGPSTGLTLPEGGVPEYLKTGYFATDNSAMSNFGNSQIAAVYGLIDYSIIPRLRLSVGVRAEKALINTDYSVYDSAKLADNDPRRAIGTQPSRINELSILPSANMLYKLLQSDENPVNLRLNYSQTVARPSMRELIRAGGSTFDLDMNAFGNSALKMVSIDNYDVRCEAFFKSGDAVSVSAFYKNFTNHIEMVQEAGYLTWRNSGPAWVKGVEVEGKKKLFSNLELSANLTLVQSQEEQHVYTSLGTIEILNHAMFGQAPYVVNGMITYSADSIGLTATASYNVQGERLAIVGNQFRPNVYEMPRHTIDFKLTKTIGKHFSANFTIRDLLNTAITRMYLYEGKEVIYDKYTYGSIYQFAMAYKF